MIVVDVFAFITFSLLLQPCILFVGVTFETQSFQKIARIKCNKV